jgi:hypothetical protein
MRLSLAYWHSGGEVLVTSGRALTLADVEALRGLYADEVRSAKAAGKTPVEAERLAHELAAALDAAIRWRRAGGSLEKRSTRPEIIFP